METIRKDFKYKIVPNFITKEEQLLLAQYTTFFHINNISEFCYQTPAGDTYVYADPLMESLLISKQPFMEKITGKKLFPAYSSWRLYTYNSTLPHHVDRPSCEISCTIHIAGNKEWPIFMDGKPLITKVGDGVIYLGGEVKHHREELKSDFHTQCFLHYVDAEGPFKDYALDKRSSHTERQKGGD